MNLLNVEIPITLQYCESLSQEEKEKVSKILEIHKLEILRSVGKEITASIAPIKKEFHIEGVLLKSNVKLIDTLYDDFISPQTSMSFERKDNENATENATK